jgi:hypothetical protein
VISPLPFIPSPPETDKPPGEGRSFIEKALMRGFMRPFKERIRENRLLSSADEWTSLEFSW